MTDKQINAYFRQAANYTDPDAFVLETLRSTTGQEHQPGTEEQLRILWHVAKDPFKDLLLRMRMSQSQCSVRFCIPLRTVQHWCAGDREAPPYVRLMLAEASGVLKLR